MSHNETSERKTSGTKDKLRNILGIKNINSSQDSQSLSSQSLEEDKYPDDTDTPDILPIFNRLQFTKQITKTQKKDNYDVSSSGRLKYKETMDLLTCNICNQLVTLPIIQCRKGHMYCRLCKHDNKMMQCSICKQTFVEAPNLALEKLISFIAVPCKYSERGCEEFVFIDSRLQHETLCKFRPIHCQYHERGCTQIHSVKDMCWHHKMCQYASYPYPNVLPSMPTRSKKTSQANGKKTVPASHQNGLPEQTT